MKLIHFFIIIALSSHSIFPTTPFTITKQFGDWIFRNIVGYVQISDLYHPHTKAYLEKLHEKYPDAFKDTSTYILQNMGPAATFQSIYFPIYWAEKLEQEHQLSKHNGLFTQATEWIALHEAGHIHNNDAANGLTAAAITGFFKRQTDYHHPCKRPHDKIEDIAKLVRSGTRPVKTLAAIYCASSLYWAFREYRADDFATKHCSNPESIAAAYEILERQAPAGILPGMRHSFKRFRLNRIAHAYKEKFGEDLPKTYHASDRVTA